MFVVFESPDSLPAASTQCAKQVVVTPRASPAKLISNSSALVQVPDALKKPSVALMHSATTVTQSELSQSPVRVRSSVLR